MKERNEGSEKEKERKGGGKVEQEGRKKERGREEGGENWIVI